MNSLTISSQGTSSVTIIFPPDSSNRVLSFHRRGGIWTGSERVNQAPNSMTPLDCSDMQEELDRILIKESPETAFRMGLA